MAIIEYEQQRDDGVAEIVELPDCGDALRIDTGRRAVDTGRRAIDTGRSAVGAGRASSSRASRRRRSSQ